MPTASGYAFASTPPRGAFSSIEATQSFSRVRPTPKQKSANNVSPRRLPERSRTEYEESSLASPTRGDQRQLDNRRGVARRQSQLKLETEVFSPVVACPVERSLRRSVLIARSQILNPSADGQGCTVSGEEIEMLSMQEHLLREEARRMLLESNHELEMQKSYEAESAAAELSRELEMHVMNQALKIAQYEKSVAEQWNEELSMQIHDDVQDEEAAVFETYIFEAMVPPTRDEVTQMRSTLTDELTDARTRTEMGGLTRELRCWLDECDMGERRDVLKFRAALANAAMESFLPTQQASSLAVRVQSFLESVRETLPSTVLEASIAERSSRENTSTVSAVRRPSVAVDQARSLRQALSGMASP